jgi:hypothetical protein
MIINYFFRKNNKISYNVLLKNYIQNVSKNNYFMNYGLWDDKINDLDNLKFNWTISFKYESEARNNNS